MKQMGLAKRAVFATIDGRNLGKHLACMKTVVKWSMREITYLSTVVQDIFHEQLIDARLGCIGCSRWWTPKVDCRNARPPTSKFMWTTEAPRVVAPLTERPAPLRLRPADEGAAHYGPWKWTLWTLGTPGKGDPFWKVSFSGSMLNLGGACF